MKNKRSLRCIGHRGAAGHAPENTLAAMHKAIKLGVKYIEIDVYNIDRNLIVFHDRRVDRMTNGNGYVSDLSYPELRALTIDGQHQIPTLPEVCDVLDQKVCLNIELKGKHTAALTVAYIQKFVRQGWSKEAFLVSSFNHHELAEVRRLDKGILLAAVHVGLPLDYAKFAQDLDVSFVHSSIEFIDKQFVEDAHSRNLLVNVFTVNHPQDIKKMFAMGVDGVFSDFPDHVLDFFPDLTATPLWLPL